MADNETIADIIAEIRALSNPISDGIIAINGKSIADRLEAAWKRERGDCAKLREALETARLFVTNCPTPLTTPLLGCGMSRAEVINIIDAALAAPPRNCDRPECATTKAAQDVWRREDGGKTAYYEWLLATYKEGGNDGR